ncbi:hypothetical protein [Halorubellus litoreus]|uniref:Tat (Twin-arginine translocation) pathway signal sequence n=1 Tax=Halorubellus litoreus TaxID=755308 RepID=A0ABD5V772_9EURY
MTSRRQLLTTAGSAVACGLAGCLSSNNRDEWLNVAGYIARNETQRTRTFELGVTDGGKPVPYSKTVQIDANNQQTIVGGTDTRSDYLVAAKAADTDVVADAKELIDDHAPWVVPKFTLETSSKLAVTGTGYEEYPREMFETTAATTATDDD